MTAVRESLFSRRRYGGKPHRGTKTERTVAVTVGAWGGVWTHGHKTCWRVCLGFVAITYVRAEMTELIEAWLRGKE